MSQKYTVWCYWETIPGKKKSSYIDLCLKSIDKYCKDDFNVIILDDKTVCDYLPNLRKDLNSLDLQKKTDYIRIALLYEYGGIWIDADTIVMKRLTPISDKLNEGWDFIGFGCTGQICFYGAPGPSNGVMASKKNSILMKNCLEDLDKVLDTHFRNPDQKKLGYYDIGKLIIWKNIERLSKSGYEYYHFTSDIDGSRDVNGHWVSPGRHISLDKVELYKEGNQLFIFLSNANLCETFLANLTSDEIMNGKWYISDLFRKSLT